jgi:hypothetical protein
MDEPPLIFLPDLAVILGLNEAIIVQHLVSSANDTNKRWDGERWWEDTEEYEGEKWVCRTLEELNNQFRYLSKKELIEILKDLIKKEIIKKRDFNNDPTDQRKWFTINDETITKLEEKLYEGI